MALILAFMRPYISSPCSSLAVSIVQSLNGLSTTPPTARMLVLVRMYDQVMEFTSTHLSWKPVWATMAARMARMSLKIGADGLFQGTWMIGVPVPKASWLMFVVGSPKLTVMYWPEGTLRLGQSWSPWNWK